ncbi:MAG: hypothetical protein ABEI74_03000, partial [Candidatus Pacearchaeota archaeon]
MIFLFASLTSAATWKANPANCPKSFNSQTCPTGEKLCGSSGGTTFCYDTSSLSAPGSSTTGQDTNQGSLAGGYIVNCEAYDGSVPYCDNGGSFWCNANSTCETQNRQTTCSANTFAYQSGSSTCASCKSTHLDCDNDGGVCEIDKGANGCGNNVAGGEYDTSCNTTVNDGQCVARTNFYDCDNDVSYDNNNNQWTGNFEIEAGESCTTDSGLSGTCQVSGSNACGTSGTDSDGNDCNCVPGKSKFETGTEAQYSTSDSENAILSFKNLGQGGLINATNSLGESWRINNKSCMVLKDGTEVCTGSDLGSGGGNGSKWNLSGDYFYNNSGNLTFNTTLASSNLSVNSSSYWNGVNSFNGTQFNDESDSLNLNLTWLTGNFLETSDESNLDVNSSDYWDGFNDPDDIQYSNLSTNFWNEDVNVGSNNFTIKGDLNATGNVTSQTDFCIEGGKCLSNTGTGSGDIEGVLTDLSPYLLNGSKSGSVDLNFNESYLNNTIDARDDTTQDTNLSGDSAGGDLSGTYPSPNVENNSITLKEQNITNENWLEDSQESNLDVNSSDKWRTAEGIIDNVSGIKGSDITNDLNWINTSDIWNRSSGNVYLSSSSDNVGIGTSSPIATLDVDGNATFGGTWENGGAEITGGDVYAQTGYFYNITSLNVTSLNINGSQIPSKDD